MENFPKLCNSLGILVFRKLFNDIIAKFKCLAV